MGEISTLSTLSPLAIVCGNGLFPFAVADAVQATGRPVFLVGLQGSAQSRVSDYPHVWVKLGQFGGFIKTIKSAGCKDVVFVGGVMRPASWRDLVPDWGMVRRLPRIFQMFRGGDNQVLERVIQLTEESGLQVVGVHEVVPDIVLAAGVLGACAPSSLDEQDIQTGFAVLSALSPHDVGQGVVVVDGRVVAVEAAEGTDAMLERVAHLRQSARIRLPKGRGVFVKAPKIGQNLRIDMPALGADTVARVNAAGLAGIAGVSGHVLLLDAGRTVHQADEAGVFLAGYSADKEQL